MRILFALFIWLTLAGSAFSQNSQAPGNIFLGDSSGNRPADSVGSEASWFIDTSSGGIYGPKTSAAWPSSPASSFGILTGPGGVIAPSLGKNVFGASNAAFGANALANIRLTDDNVFGNVAVGVNAMFGNLAGRRSVAVGNYALYAATNTDATVAVGYGALQNYNDVEGGVAVGNQALFNSTTSLANIAIGNTSLYNLIAGGGLNVGVGHHTLYSATTAGGNNVMGYESGYDVTIGGFNTFIGHNTGRGITTGSNNTIIGGQVVGLSAGLTGAVILATGDGTIRLDYNKTLPNYWFAPNAASIAGVLIQGTIIPVKYTIGTLVTCDAATLGAYSTVTDGADYDTGKYGSAVGAAGAVTRKVLCTNTAGPTIYAWAYD